ncbi:MAG: nucleotidyltransferase [Isosphaeraceae bacterium]
MEIQKDLKEFIELLNLNQVKYLIAGGYAVAFHGHPRTTGDIDLFVESSPENARKLVGTLDAFGFAGLGLTDRDFLTPGVIVQLGQPPNRIDLLTSLSGVVFEDAWHHRVECVVDGLRIAFLDRRTLLVNKAATGRAKDLADLEALSDETASEGEPHSGPPSLPKKPRARRKRP